MKEETPKLFVASCQTPGAAQYQIAMADVGFGACYKPRWSEEILVRVGISEAYNPLTNTMVEGNPTHLVTALPALTLHREVLHRLWDELDEITQDGKSSKPFMTFEPGTSKEELNEWMVSIFGARPTNAASIASAEEKYIINFS